MKWSPLVILICISQIISDSQHFVLYLVIINAWFNGLFLIRLFRLCCCFLLFCYWMNSLHVLNINQSTCQIYNLHFLQFCRWCLHSVECFLCCVEVLLVWQDIIDFWQQWFFLFMNMVAFPFLCVLLHFFHQWFLIFL